MNDITLRASLPRLKRIVKIVNLVQNESNEAKEILPVNPIARMDFQTCAFNEAFPERLRRCVIQSSSLVFKM